MVRVLGEIRVISAILRRAVEAIGLRLLHPMGSAKTYRGDHE
jgi:hypothetical protein